MSQPVLTDGAASARLWQAQEDKASTNADVDVSNPPAYDSDEVLLTSMTKQEEVTLSGTATGMRLSHMDGFSGDPVTALAEWCQLMMAFVNGNQGTGYELRSEERDRTIPGVVGEFGWTREEGAKYEAQWNISFKRGEGVMGKEPIDPAPADPRESASVGGVDLQTIMDVNEQKQQKFDPAPLALAESADSTIQSADSGSERRINITGRHTGSIADRKQFDEALRSMAGQDETVEYRSAFPGHELTVMVDNFESTRESGWTRLGEYSLELVEGVK